MRKRLAQFFALFAMMVSVVNAQCAVSCEITAPSPSKNSAGITVNQEQHACCPHEGAPEPKQGKEKVPCPQPLPAASKDRAVQSDTGVDLMLTVLLTDSIDRDLFVTAKGRFDSPLFSTGPAPNQSSSVFILKI